MAKILTPPPAEQLSMFAHPDDVRDAAATMSYEVLACRELSHPWGAYVATFNRDSNMFERTLRCSRCGTLKVQELTRSGAIYGSHYIYPEGYLMAKGIGRIVGEGRDALRLEALTRAVQGSVPSERKRS